MKKRLTLLLAIFCILGYIMPMYATTKKQTFSVLQLNLWHGGTKVPNGYNAVLNTLNETDADIIFLCEIRDGNQFMAQLVKDLQEKGKTYYGETLGLSVGILSKYKFDDISKRCIVPGDEGRAMIKADVTIAGQAVSLYSCHLDYKHYECYMPRGYSGTTWKKIEKPITDEKTVLEANRLSFRDESIQAFINEAEADFKKGRWIIMGGDFNEPSHMDWQENTKNLWDHNGAVINWQCSMLLTYNGFVDSFRSEYPNPVSHPGFTFPAGNKVAEEAKLEKLAWAPEADERDRIDFIYFYPTTKAFSLKKSIIVGPSETVIKGKIEKNDSKDKFFTPKCVWPSDHKGNLATFKIH